MIRRLLLGLAAILLLGAPVEAAERIERFVSDVTVQKSGVLDVTETIRVISEDDQIRHGILRDFPTIYSDRNGASVVVGFDVRSVMRDGKPEPFSVESIGNGKRVRIGTADVFVGEGPHDYVIAYQTTRQIGYFDDFDELYWNATGNGWTFPIESAEARITLPAPVNFGNTAIYTGPQGSKDQNAAIISNQPGRIVFRTTEPLAAGSGLTVAAAWPKGVVDVPTAGQRATWWLTDNLGAIFAVFGTLGGLGYFAHAWRTVGRDPPHGPIIPLFSPPEGLTAAATRYIAEMDFDNRAFTAAILDLGVHGRLALADEDSGLVLSHRSGGKPIGSAEAAAEAQLFRGTDRLALQQTNHAALSAARGALRGGLAGAYAGKIFHWNSGWLSLGIFITVAVYVLVAIGLIVSMGGDSGVGALVGLAFASVPGILLGIALGPDRKSGSWISIVLGWLLMLVFALGFGIAGLGAVIASARGPLDYLPLLLPFVLMPVLVSSFSWMRSPTADGQRLRDAIAGFRQYLGVAEENRLEVLNPPEKTPELFERYLPYAVALDVENAWAAKFASILAAAGASAAVAHWYMTSSNRDATSLVNALGSSLSQTVAAASTAPGSSSGSSGGGSSGGGGGGGGGSGW
jgi:uncharacterized membrane protein YgcG